LPIFHVELMYTLEQALHLLSIPESPVHFGIFLMLHRRTGLHCSVSLSEVNSYALSLLLFVSVSADVDFCVIYLWHVLLPGGLLHRQEYHMHASLNKLGLWSYGHA
jgi:hypothetical protein